MSNITVPEIPGFLDLFGGADLTPQQLRHDPDATAAMFRGYAADAKCPKCGRVRNIAGHKLYRCPTCSPALVRVVPAVPADMPV